MRIRRHSLVPTVILASLALLAIPAAQGAFSLTPTAGAATVSANAPNNTTVVTTTFTGAVITGTDMGTIIAGPITLTVGIHGRFSGSGFFALTQSVTRTVTVAVTTTGAISGSAVEATYYLRNGARLIASGRVSTGFVFRGTFFGPRRGDVGLWKEQPRR